jgi:hypothetical protein
LEFRGELADHLLDVPLYITALMSASLGYKWLLADPVLFSVAILASKKNITRIEFGSEVWMVAQGPEVDFRYEHTLDRSVSASFSVGIWKLKQISPYS